MHENEMMTNTIMTMPQHMKDALNSKNLAPLPPSPLPGPVFKNREAIALLIGIYMAIPLQDM